MMDEIQPTHVKTSIDASETAFDAIIIGGGHNGLTCAAYLARAGKKVAVLEAQSVVGGYCTTQATIADAPGFLMNTCAIDHILVNLPPSVVDELQLSRYGLRYFNADPLITYIGEDGECLPIWQNLDKAVAEISRFSRRDAQQYRKLATGLADAMHVLLPYFAGDPKHIRPMVWLRVLKRAIACRKSLSAVARVLISPTAPVVEEWFERDEVRSAVGTYATYTTTSLDAPGIGLSLLPVMHRWGMRRPVGGSGAFTRALMDCVRAHGGAIYANARAAEVIVRNERTQAVRLESGMKLKACHVIGAIDPTTLMTQLLNPELLPDQTRAELRGMQVSSHNVGAFKIDVALRSRRPPFARLPDGEGAPAAQAVISSFSHAKAAMRRAMAKELPEDPVPITALTPSFFDRSLVPVDSGGDTLYIYPLGTPYELSGGRNWETEKLRYVERCLDVVEHHAPGTRDRIIGMNVRSPLDFPSHNGCLYHVDMLPWQMGPWRPTPSLAGYRTPIQGLWHTGAGAHPVGGLCGWSGRSAARMVLRRWNRN